MNCVSFLVSFGTNLWALDNDFHTALDVAALNEHNEIVTYLDNVIARQSGLNVKLVKKMKERAVLEAHKRVRKYDKMQEKAQKKAEKEEKRLAKDRQRMSVDGNLTASTSTNSTSAGGTVRSSVSSKYSVRSKSSFSSQPKPYSEHFRNGSNYGKKFTVGGVARKVTKKKKTDVNSSRDFKIGEIEQNGRRTVKSLAGLKRDSQVLFIGNGYSHKTKALDTVSDSHSIGRVSRAFSEPDFTYSNGFNDHTDSSSIDHPSLFERPGFGNVAFFNRRNTSGALQSLPRDSDSGQDEPHSDQSEGSKSAEQLQREGSITDSIGTVGSLAARMQALPWNQEDVENLSEDEDVESSQLELFLAANNLAEFLLLLTREKIDLEALVLCSDADLKELGLPLGPRRKMLDAITRRSQILSQPSVMEQTFL